jgi:hypothetical protein
VHACEDGWHFPLLYCALPDKKKSTYVRMWKMIVELLRADLEVSFISDFEIGLFLACLDFFAEDDLAGCFFHFNQSIMKHVDSLGLRPKYIADFDFRVRVKNLSSLAFLPASDIPDAFDLICGSFERDEWPLRDYFEKTYIGERKARRVNRAKPLFAPDFWSVHGRRDVGLDTTTNACERFHKIFKGRFANPYHPPVPEFLQALRRQQADTDISFGALQRGERRLPSRQWVAAADETKRFVEQYDADHDALGFLQKTSLFRLSLNHIGAV